MDAKELLLTNNNIVQNQLTRICSDLTDAQVSYGHEAVDERGIANVVVHLYGGVLNRSCALLGIDRDPVPELPQTTAGLLAYVDTAHARANELIGRITDAQLSGVVKVGSNELVGANAMLDIYAHAFRHVGNVLDARHLGGFETHALG
ncbi:MAG: hypothetical protein EXR58_08125 [Chloroflexi bacterium]|nr:hypothetical protein [Chloroflexota bacterium]